MLDRLLGSVTPCPCGTTHVVTTRRVAVRRGALAELGPMARGLDLAGPALVVADPDTWAAAGAGAVESLAHTGLTVRTLVLDAHPVAGPEGVAQVVAHVGDAGLLVAVGAGTVNDLVKSAATACALPYLAVGTALSMNGYTSSISALLEGGVKRTLPATPPLGVVLDLDVCAAAPRTMTLAGLGDMLSKPFSEADWRLSAHVDRVPYCARPGAVLEDAFARMVAAAAGIGRAEPTALAHLSEALLLSGMSMAMAGTSAPASGGEHLISHYWDMMRYGMGAHPYALHGTQVGVACCLVEPLHRSVQALRGRSLRTSDLDALLADWPTTLDGLRSRVRACHTELPPDVVDGVVAEAAKKWRPPEAQRVRLESIAENLDPILADVGAALLPDGAIRQALRDAGAPTTAAEIDPSLAGDLVRWAKVRDIRARYTILDFAAELGALTEGAR